RVIVGERGIAVALILRGHVAFAGHGSLLGLGTRRQLTPIADAGRRPRAPLRASARSLRSPTPLGAAAAPARARAADTARTRRRARAPGRAPRSGWPPGCSPASRRRTKGARPSCAASPRRRG